MEDLTANTHNLSTILANVVCNTLLLCPVRFSGVHDVQKIKHFIEYVKFYKRIKCISDEQALQELGNLLTDSASRWWQRRKSNVTAWSEALNALENEYTKQRSALQIYSDVFKNAYESYTAKEDFINDKHELLSELSDPKLTEKNKADMIFGLLSNFKQTEIKNSNKPTSSMDLEEHHNTGAVCEVNGDKGSTITTTITKSQPHCLDSPDVDITSNAKDPIIQVRCAVDLMPQIKLEQIDETVGHQKDVLINTESNAKNNQADENTNFQIDADLMNQINSIIDESEMNCVNESSLTAMTSTLNNDNIIPAENTQILAMKRPRCNFCRSRRHLAETCFKKANAQKASEELNKMTTTNNIGNVDLATNILPPSASKNNNIPPLTEQHIPAYSIAPFISPNTFLPSVPTTFNPIMTSASDPSSCGNHKILNNKRKAPKNKPGSSKQQSTTHRNVPKWCHQCGKVGFIKSNCPNCSTIQAGNTQRLVRQRLWCSFCRGRGHRAVTCPKKARVALLKANAKKTSNELNKITSTSGPPSSGNHNPLTKNRKAAINEPGTSKQLATTLRNIIEPTPKCHQCGKVGFYKSICPNCSPIYNCKKK